MEQFNNEINQVEEEFCGYKMFFDYCIQENLTREEVTIFIERAWIPELVEIANKRYDEYIKK